MGQFEQTDSKIFNEDPFSHNQIILVHLSAQGPVIEKHGMGSSPLESTAIPQEQLSAIERLALEAAPPMPTDKANICAPLTKEDREHLGPGPISYCKLKPVSQWNDEEKTQYIEQSRLHLVPGEKVARTPNGDYLIINPIFTHILGG